MKRGRSLAAVFLALASWLGSAEAASNFVYGTGTDVTVEGPFGPGSGIGPGVAIVDPVIDPPGEADDWKAPLYGSDWITPAQLASGRFAENALPGSYIYTFGITVPFLEDPTDPFRFDPEAKLDFSFFADNSVSNISLFDQFGERRDVGITNIHDMNTLGKGTLDLGFLRSALARGDTYSAEVMVTVENSSLPDPDQRNPTGLDLSVWAIGSVPVPIIPEPETYALMLAGLGLIGLMVRRKKVENLIKHC